MQTRYETWVEGLNQDWCISRQRFFGVPFPVWYKVDENGNTDYDSPIYPDISQLPIDPMVDVPNGYTEAQRGQKGGFVGDKDIMDTWATSSVTPQIAMAFAPEGHHISLPFDVRPQAHDIIRTWAFYTIMKAFANENTLPWYEAHISGFVLDPDRKKMSKSKGNVITPMALLEKYSSDAVRYWASRAKLGIDALFEEQIMEQGKKLCMKFFNATRFVFNIVAQSGVDVNADYVANITDELDKSWIGKMMDAVETSRKAFAANDYSFALETTEHTFWDFCDNYLEIVKGRAYGDNPTSAVSALMLSIDLFCKMFAPFLVFITEEVYQARPWGKNAGSVHVEAYPAQQDYKAVTMDEDFYNKVVSMVEAGRKAKADEKRSLRAPIVAVTVSANQKTIDVLRRAQGDIERVLNIKDGKIVFESNTDDLVLTNCLLGEDEPKKPKA